MLSMTGFGIVKSKLAHGELVTQVKSVNSRFLDIKINLPKEYNFFEKDVRELLKKNLSRGNVEVYCSRKYSKKQNSVSIKTDLVLAKKWLTSYKKLNKDLKLKSDGIELKDIAKFVPVLTLQEDKSITLVEKKVFIKSVNDAIALCLQEREREGRALKKVLKSTLDQLAKEVKIIQDNRKKANKELEKRWQEKITRFEDHKSIEPSRLAQEAAILIDKSDINEEIVRLTEHIQTCKKLLTQTGRIGKKLDFYSQELLREVNTIGSKSQVTELTHSVVNAKTLIEQLREQVQNIE